MNDKCYCLNVPGATFYLVDHREIKPKLFMPQFEKYQRKIITKDEHSKNLFVLILENRKASEILKSGLTSFV